MKGLVTLFKALSDETRLRILKLLEHGELCVCDIVAALDIVQPKASFHLATLKSAALVKDRREGKWMHYRIDDSDLFKRLLILSLTERIPDHEMEEHRKRLGQFLRSREDGPAGSCCGPVRTMRSVNEPDKHARRDGHAGEPRSGRG